MHRRLGVPTLLGVGQLGVILDDPTALHRFGRPAHQHPRARASLHCVPGTWAEKGRAFGHIAQVMADDGMFFGSTILDTGAHHTPLSLALNSLYNGPIKLFHNRGDDLDCLHTALVAAFGEVGITVVGAVAVFAARLPRRLGS